MGAIQACCCNTKGEKLHSPTSPPGPNYADTFNFSLDMSSVDTLDSFAENFRTLEEKASLTRSCALGQIHTKNNFGFGSNVTRPRVKPRFKKTRSQFSRHLSIEQRGSSVLQN